MPLENSLALTQLVGVAAFAIGTVFIAAAVWFHLRSITAKYTELHYASPGRVNRELAAGAAAMDYSRVHQRNKCLVFAAMFLALGAGALFVLPPVLTVLAGQEG